MPTTTASPMDNFVTTSSPIDVNNNQINNYTGNTLHVPGQTTFDLSSNSPSSPSYTRPTSADPWAELIKPQIFVVKNPMHVINFNQNRSKSKLVRFFQLLKSFTEKWFSHILLLGVLFLYGCFGAWMFILIEGGVRQEIQKPLINMKGRIKSDILYFALHPQYSREFVSKLIDRRLFEFELQVQENCKNGFDGEDPLKTWSFWNALFFCVTVFTTIGYGHIFPETTYGKVFCIVYAFFGIPLVLIVLTDLGKLFTRMIKTAMRAIMKLVKHKRLHSVRQMGRRATMAPIQFWSDTKRRLSSVPNESFSNSNEAIGNSNTNVERTEITFNADGNGAITAVTAPTPSKASFNAFNSSKYNTVGTPPPIVISQSPFGPLTSRDTFNHFGAAGNETGTTQYSPDLTPYEVDEEFNLPVTAAMFILIMYFLLGSILFFNTEKWTLLESFYFVYISLTTVGFGDYVPQSPILMLAASIYILFGLALTSMCINVIQEKLSQSLEKAKERLGARIGLSTGPEVSNDTYDLDVKEANNRPLTVGKDISTGSSRKSSTTDADSKPKVILQDKNVGEKLKKRREMKKTEVDFSSTQI